METRIILPTYNEIENIKILIPKIFNTFKSHGIRGDVLVVDDNSPDGTADFLEELKKYSVKVVRRERKMGLGSAYIKGFKESLKDGKDVIFEMDADLSHDPSYIPYFIRKIMEGFDVVIGAREEIVGWNWYRKSVSFCGNFIGRNLAGIKIKDLTTGYRAYRKEVLKSVNLDKIKSSGYAFQLEIMARCISSGFIVGSIPIVFYNRSMGNSKLSREDILEFFMTALKIRLGFLND